MLARIYVTGLAFYLAHFLSPEMHLLNRRLVISSFTNVNTTRRDREAKPSVSKALVNLPD